MSKPNVIEDFENSPVNTPGASEQVTPVSSTNTPVNVPETQPEQVQPEPQIEVTVKDNLFAEMEQPKDQYEQPHQSGTKTMEDLLGDIPTEQTTFDQFEFDQDPGEQAEDDPGQSGSGINTGRMVTLLVKNADYVLSSLNGWLNSNPRRMYQAEPDDIELLEEAVTGYTDELEIEIDPKQQLFLSFAMVYGGGFVTGVFKRTKGIFEKAYNRVFSKKQTPGAAKTPQEVETVEAEVIDETENEKICALPGCKNAVAPNRKYCCADHQRKHNAMKQKGKPKKAKTE